MEQQQELAYQCEQVIQRQLPVGASVSRHSCRDSPLLPYGTALQDPPNLHSRSVEWAQQSCWPRTVWYSAAPAWPLQIRNFHRLNSVSKMEAKDPGVKIQFRIQGAFDIFGPTKAMLLTIKEQIRDG